MIACAIHPGREASLFVLDVQVPLCPSCVAEVMRNTLARGDVFIATYDPISEARRAEGLEP